MVKMMKTWPQYMVIIIFLLFESANRGCFEFFLKKITIHYYNFLHCSYQIHFIHQSGLDVMYTVMFKKGTAFHYPYASPEKVKLT